MNIIEEQNKKAKTNHDVTGSSPTPPISESNKKVYSRPLLVVLTPPSTQGAKNPIQAEGTIINSQGLPSPVGSS
jgi:hypothetical protein